VTSARSGSGGAPGGGGGRGKPPERPPHWIRPEEVDAWLADSMNKRVTYHRTTRLAAQNILEGGVDIERSRGGAFGRGFYTATDAGPFAGDAMLDVAIRTCRPLAGHLDEIEAQLDEFTARFSRTRRLTPRVAEQIRQELLGLGYDGLIVRDAGGDGIDYVVALTADAVKVVQP
jgi:hypothetical protein